MAMLSMSKSWITNDRLLQWQFVSIGGCGGLGFLSSAQLTGWVTRRLFGEQPPKPEQGALAVA
jgi:hypothetical protein